jgi:hypothetical protein
MEFIELDFPMVALIMMLVCLVIMMITIGTLIRIRREQKRYIKKLYPELSEIDLKYRRTQLIQYQRLYLNSGIKNILHKLSIFVIMIGVIITYLSLIFTELDNISFLVLSLCLYLAAFFVLSQPSVNKQYDFWHDYLEKNPDNPLKVYLVPIETARRIRNKVNIIGVCYVIMATLALGLFFY